MDIIDGISKFFKGIFSWIWELLKSFGNWIVDKTPIGDLISWAFGSWSHFGGSIATLAVAGCVIYAIISAIDES